MTVLAVSVAVMALVLAVLFTAVVAGIRQAHPTDLSLQRPALLEALARRVLGLYVRRGVPVQRPADSDADYDWVTR
jgi:energy-converting hydrogenase Eha subunit F